MKSRSPFVALALLAGAPTYAQVTSTRTTTFDWQCQNADGTRISDHQRYDSALVACLNLTLKDGKTRYVQGGRYRLQYTAPAPSPAPSPTPTPTPSPTPSPTPVTGSATLKWTPPTQNTDGSALTDLAGYRVKCGKVSADLNLVVQVANPGLSTTTVPGLSAGTWYCAVTAYSSAGNESALSAIVSKVIS